jgi:hypothetical protein
MKSLFFLLLIIVAAIGFVITILGWMKNAVEYPEDYEDGSTIMLNATKNQHNVHY